MLSKRTLMIAGCLISQFNIAINVNASMLQCILFSPYQQMSANIQGNEPQDLVAISNTTGIKSFNLAFIKDSGNCNPIWSGGNLVSTGWGQKLTENMRAAGIQYRISFGGAGNDDLSDQCSAAQLTSIYQNIVNTYQPTGLDFDIEDKSVNVTKLISSLKTLATNNPDLKISFTLPVMPNGLDSEAKKVVSLATQANINYVVNIMVMDYSSAYTQDMGQYAIQAANSTYAYIKTLYPQQTAAQIWQMIGLTPMIGVNDVAGEVFTLSNTDALNSFAQEKQLAWLSMWSLGRDKPCSSTKPNSSCSGGNVQVKNYEFSQHMLQCSNTPVLDCLPPTDINATVSANKKSITLSWQNPQKSQPVLNYQVDDYQNKLLWKGTTMTYTDNSLIGKKGTYEYFLYSQCTSELSKPVEYSVIVK